MGIGGIDQLEELERRLLALANFGELAAKAAEGPLLAVARGEWGAGQKPGGDSQEALKAGSGAPLTALTSGITSDVSGSKLTITTPEELKYHQGGFIVHAAAEQRALREAQASVRSAKSDADADGLKRARARVRAVKKEIKARGTPVAKRPTLPGRRSVPVTWARVINDAMEKTIKETLEGA